MTRRICALAALVFLALVLALPLHSFSGQDMVSGPGEFPIVEEADHAAMS